MTTQTRIELRHECDETLAAIVDKSAHPYDAYASRAQESALTAALYDRWQAGVTRAMAQIRGQVALTKENVMYLFNTNLGFEAMTRSLAPAISPEVWAAFNNGRAGRDGALYQADGPRSS